MKTIPEIYQLATQQSLRSQDEKLVRQFAIAVLFACAEDILDTLDHSDVANHDFEDGKEAVAKHMMAVATSFLDL